MPAPTLLSNRSLLPLGLIAAVALTGALATGGGAGAAGAPATPTPISAAPPAKTTAAVHRPVQAPHCEVNSQSLAKVNPHSVGVTGAYNSGAPNSSIQIHHQGCLVAYGNRSILYVAPPRSLIPLGEELFQTYCSSCHGPHADGSTGRAPNLLGLGPATVDFWVTTGRMPADNTTSQEAQRKPPKLNDRQAAAVAAWVNSLAPATPFIPKVNLSGANIADGQNLFVLNCAACHTITGAGDALAYSTFAPTLHAATLTQVAEAIRTGPANMPRFTGNLTDAQVRDIALYVTSKIQHPANIGGWGLGGIGPVTEGFIALLFGVGILMLFTFWIGDRQ